MPAANASNRFQNVIRITDPTTPTIFNEIGSDGSLGGLTAVKHATIIEYDNDAGGVAPISVTPGFAGLVIDAFLVKGVGTGVGTDNYDVETTTGLVENLDCNAIAADAIVRANTIDVTNQAFSATDAVLIRPDVLGAVTIAARVYVTVFRTA